jgi:hypothetical protein
MKIKSNWSVIVLTAGLAMLYACSSSRDVPTPSQETVNAAAKPQTVVAYWKNGKGRTGFTPKMLNQAFPQAWREMIANRRMLDIKESGMVKSGTDTTAIFDSLLLAEVFVTDVEVVKMTDEKYNLEASLADNDGPVGSLYVDLAVSGTTTITDPETGTVTPVDSLVLDVVGNTVLCSVGIKCTSCAAIMSVYNTFFGCTCTNLVGLVEPPDYPFLCKASRKGNSFADIWHVTMIRLWNAISLW